MDVRTDPSIAAGEVPWGLGPHLTELVPGTRALSVTAAGLAEVLDAARGFRTVVVVTREAHRPPVREFLAALRKSVSFVHVETGTPGTETGTGDRIDTFSGSYVSLRATAEYLARMPSRRTAQ